MSSARPALLRRPRLPALLRGRSRRVAAAPPTPARPEPGRLEVPVIAPTEDERVRARTFDQGRHLARQEDWAELGRILRGCDATRACAPGGTPLSLRMAEGARSDAVMAGAAAAHRGAAEQAFAAIAALDAEREALCCDHGIALVVALAHVDLGTAWRGTAPWSDRPIAARAAFHAHFRAGSRILDRFDPVEADAPSLAAARCAVLPALPDARSRVLDDYTDLVELDPGCPDHMRAFGRALLPGALGDDAALEDGARRAAAATADIWGMGGYTWVYFDAVAVDPGACASLDAELFVEGLHDILAARPTQDTANRLAALTGYSLACSDSAPDAQRRIARAFDWIVTDHLREVHPAIWAAAPAPVPGLGPAGTDPAPLGGARALSSLGGIFGPELARGLSVRVDGDRWQIS